MELVVYGRSRTGRRETELVTTWLNWSRYEAAGRSVTELIVAWRSWSRCDGAGRGVTKLVAAWRSWSACLVGSSNLFGGRLGLVRSSSHERHHYPFTTTPCTVHGNPIARRSSKGYQLLADQVDVNGTSPLLHVRCFLGDVYGMR